MVRVGRLLSSRVEILLALLLCPQFAHSQTSRGAISGTITDSSGAVVVGVEIAITHAEAGVRRSTVTNDAGVYRLEAVDLGRYTLAVTHPGFRPFLATSVGVQANHTTTIDVRLEVGPVDEQVTVSAEAEELLIRDGPLRGGHFQSRQVRDLPLIGLNPLSLARTLPGVSHATGGVLWKVGWEQTNFSVNGQRVRGNNFLLDGTENNDISFTGVAQPVTIAEAIEEVSAQTGNFSVEFGRAGGGVFNVITRSGTNSVHGSLLWRYQSQRFESVSNVDKLNRIPKSVFSRNVYGLTLGGPARKDKTFFFAGFQQDNLHSTRNFPLVVPTEAAVTRLRSIFPSNSRLDLYLDLLGSLCGEAAPINLNLGIDPVTSVDRGSVQFATAPLALPASSDGPQWLVRFDHHHSDNHRLSWRYVYDSRVNSPRTVEFPGFINDQAAQNGNLLFADTFTFSPVFTNEFRFSYGRLRADDPFRISPLSIPLAHTLPDFTIQNIAAPGVSNTGQFRLANNLLFQETQTKLHGRHTFRYGVEFLGQVATQAGVLNTSGSYHYMLAPGYSAFANYLDDFSGWSGQIRRSFGDGVFHPNIFRQSYFFQDTWKATPALTVTLGLRYENFGQPLNALRYPAFPGFDPDRFLDPARVNRDDNNLGPAFGLAWAPSFPSGWLGTLFGDRKTVWRGGYQISYDAWFTQMVSLQAGSGPNVRNTDDRAPLSGRGWDNFLARMPDAPRPASPLEPQTYSSEENLRSPYTERWSFGFQRQLADKLVLDVAYVGSVSHKLTTRTDFNPLQADGVRLYPALGQRWVRTSQGNSAYHALQSRVERRFGQGFQVTGSYTWSRSLDSTSEGAAAINTQSASVNLTSVPAARGGMKLDRGLSDFHRAHRLTLVYIWDVPGPRRTWWRHVLAGWSIAGITSFQSGTPFTVVNGLDRNSDGVPNIDRPDIGNPRVSLFSRAVAVPQSGVGGCVGGYLDLDTGDCAVPAEVRWLAELPGLLPGASTVGRNTLLTGGTNNFDLSVFKSFPIGERGRLELRWEALNAFNHPQFTEVPQHNVAGTPGPGGGLPSRFLNRDFTNSGIRSMWVQVKVLF